MSLSGRVFVIGRQTDRHASDGQMSDSYSIRALRALSAIPNRGGCIAGAVARQASRSKRGCRASSVWDPRDGAERLERLRTHPATREAQLTCAERDWHRLARDENQATTRCPPTLHSYTHYLRPRLTHAIHTLFISTDNTHNSTLTTTANANTTTTYSPPSAYGLAIPPGYIANHRPILALT